MKTSKRRTFTTTERLAAISVVMVLWIGGLGARLVHLQVYEHDWLEERAIRQQERTVEVSPTRGRILDRKGRELARSIEADSIYATLSQIKDPGSVAHRLAPILDVPEKTLLDRLTCDRSFVCLKQSVDTTTSYGRLILTFLAALAQFERETTAERTRDAMAARSQRGLVQAGR